MDSCACAVLGVIVSYACVRACACVWLLLLLLLLLGGFTHVRSATFECGRDFIKCPYLEYRVYEHASHIFSYYY